MPRAVKAELRGLPADLAEKVGGHLLMAGQLIDTDPVEAQRYAAVARRHAARLPVVREAAAETAYAAEDFAAALQDFRTLRRMTGSDEYLPVIADCLRALGKPDEALATAREGSGGRLPVATRVELRIVEAGAREDLGQVAEAKRLLRKAWDAEHNSPAEVRARLAYAYAAVLEREGNTADSRAWFARAADADPEATDAADHLRVDRTDDIEVEFDAEGEE
ncbi:hypothetical protein CLV29_0693 [Naumannella halotolerans]|uniref:Tetratricopeptide repeat protein n=1 Tax=Naumannella halotolerans TaxID=993414 RepID=A0A4R7J6Q6_9ACTN|nr:hypothetical protein CLV29_0693 [Naumannella halotolerans]